MPPTARPGEGSPPHFNRTRDNLLPLVHSRYTFPSCLPDPDRLVVPTRPGVVRAAPTLSCTPRIRLPSASLACCDRPTVESFHLHPIDWRLDPHQPVHHIQVGISVSASSGNRTLNAVIHMAAVTQLRHTHSEGRAYFERKVAEGKTKREALRSLI